MWVFIVVLFVIGGGGDVAVVAIIVGDGVGVVVDAVVAFAAVTVTVVVAGVVGVAAATGVVVIDFYSLLFAGCVDCCVSVFAASFVAVIVKVPSLSCVYFILGKESAILKVLYFNLIKAHNYTTLNWQLVWHEKG